MKQSQRYIEALDKFVHLIHDDRFSISVPMEKGKMLIMNNWRVLHGRKANTATPSRVLVGGTITREAYYCKGVELAERIAASQQ